MRFLKSLSVAFAIYSKIPVPKFNWDSSDMKYHLCFFPWVGAVIGALEFVWYKIFPLISSDFSAKNLIFSLIAIAIPILVTGGFHLDGFLDTTDALNSYAEREKKLEILKDSHIGAFSVISFALYLIFALALVLAILPSKTAIFCACGSFFVSRCFSALTVILFPKAKKEGMLYAESRIEKGEKIVCAFIFVQLLIAAAILIYFCRFFGVFGLLGMFLCFIYYFFMTKKQFGGITGDTAGFFVCISELFFIAFEALFLILRF